MVSARRLAVQGLEVRQWLSLAPGASDARA